jgi:DNA-directed RNA polymerase specialized sigma24 family protein
MVQLRPYLMTFAATFAPHCASTREDYVSAAYVALLSSQKWKNPLVAAFSAMRQEKRKAGRWGWPKGTTEMEPEYLMDDLLQFEELRDLKWLDVDSDHKRAATLHWVEGLSQQEIGVAMGVSTKTVNKWVAAVKEQVRLRWFEPEAEPECKEE